ncbi:outer membrane lipoprotein carrier protein LolA [Weeksellaceae bacterium A-14]
MIKRKEMRSLFSKIFLSVALAGGFTFVSAQKADSKSQQILNRVSAKYKANRNTYFKFMYSTGNNGKITKKETGIFYTAPSRYKLKIMGTEQIFDGSKIYSISDEDHEVTIAKANGSEMMFSPTNYLDSYKKEYNTTYIGKKSVAGKTTDMIRLVPIKNNGIREVDIYIDSAKSQLVKIEQKQTDNALAIIQITDYRANQNLAKDIFSFSRSKYKNYLITEL